MFPLSLSLLLLCPSESPPTPTLLEAARILGTAGGLPGGATIAGGSNDTFFASWAPGFAFDVNSRLDKAGELRVVRIKIRKRNANETLPVIPGLQVKRESLVEKIWDSGFIMYMILSLADEMK
jgi:hypothetical protein